ncbi:MAG: hypothetical protein M2R45_01109 [Verrucomicrobia subdivision 3 bacterium]|nr:hypothetical protein [Limisphaerales bacterium]MCS1414220.1 hypothetical protein [Limisphaerales bacterium]
MEAELSNALGQTNFTAFDWVIITLYLSISLVIGLLVKKYVRNMATYLGAGRAVGTCLGITTMTGTEMGLITVMYSAQKGFTSGFAAFHIAIAAGIVTFVVGMTGFIVCRLRDLQVLTIPEFYEKRFDRKTRILGGIMLTFGGVLNIGLFLKVGSMFVVGITGLSQDSMALPLNNGHTLSSGACLHRARGNDLSYRDRLYPVCGTFRRIAGRHRLLHSEPRVAARF